MDLFVALRSYTYLFIRHLRYLFIIIIITIIIEDVVNYNTT
jgi:hypothetical protein